ncbi:MAG TPA: response regulator [bacterium]|nr:response regulator [bacterium]HPJ71171.1 response regulator [bacterium]HPQ65901.1 response regulator [bacterium]
MNPATIFIIDDDEDFLDELRESLRLEGHRVEAFSDGNKALGAMLRLRPDLVVVDLKMRGLNGFQVVEEMRNRPATGEVPVIAMTGYYTRVEHGRLMKLCGIDSCMIKPFSTELLNRRIALTLKKRGRAAEPKSEPGKELPEGAEP